ncbi:redox-regulated ATPase YchF [Candidatus Saccharibacteria bacterium]|nr:MAG: redox-regulated ATPase YchF [Candidatus Saccharibacteria bacterium]
MSLSIAIIGLPNVGKSTLFNALTDSNILAANYPFATIEPNTGIVPVPDLRLNKLSELYGGAPIKPATVTFVDVAGLVKGASKGEGLGNQFLSHIRTTNAIVQVVRAFHDPAILVDGRASANDLSGSSSGQPDPATDIDIINTELVLADLQTVTKRLPIAQKEAKANPKLKPNADFLEQVQQALDSGEPLWSEPTVIENDLCEWLQKELQLLTLKPVIYLFNVDEEGLGDAALQQKLSTLVAPSQALFVCAKLEDELRGLDDADRAEMLESYGVAESGLNQLIHAAYKTLGLQSYLTAGDKEVRAWTIPQGATAPQAAGVIHGDFERGFIAADIVNYDELMAAGSLQAAKAAGKLATVGKTYVMQPNDIVEFKFNV